jgi:hypothetical protein
MDSAHGTAFPALRHRIDRLVRHLGLHRLHTSCGFLGLVNLLDHPCLLPAPQRVVGERRPPPRQRSYHHGLAGTRFTTIKPSQVDLLTISDARIVSLNTPSSSEICYRWRFCSWLLVCFFFFFFFPYDLLSSTSNSRL